LFVVSQSVQLFGGLPPNPPPGTLPLDPAGGSAPKRPLGDPPAAASPSQKFWIATGGNPQNIRFFVNNFQTVSVVHKEVLS